MKHYLAIVLAAIGLSSAGRADSSGSDWPRWRGAGFDGTAVTGSAVFARPFELRVRWKRPLGAGYSGVVVAAGHAVTMFSDGTRDFVTSLSADAGKEEWRAPVGAAFPGRDGSAGGPVSTPAIDEGIVFALGPHGLLVAVRIDSGTELWRRDLVADLGGVEPHWGFTTSPLVAGANVVVMTGGPNGRAIAAFDKRTGRTVWHSGSDVVSFQSPMLATLAGEQRVLAGGDQSLVALDAATGREVWRYDHGGRGFYAKIINPVAVSPDRFLLTYRPDESVLLRVGPSTEPVWTTRELKLNYATPVVHEGFVFGYSGGFLSAVDARTGTLAWRSRAPGDGFPILVDGHLVVLTKQGTVTVAPAAADGYKEKAALPLFDRLVWTPPSFAGGRIFARDSYAEIAAVDVVPASRTTDAAPPPPAPGTIPSSSFGRWVASVEGAPDAAAKVKQYLDAQKSFPIVEDERFAHIVYTGTASDLRLRADVLETGQEIPMRRIQGTDAYYASIELAPDARVVYQFVQGFGEFSADARNPVGAPSLNYAAPTSLLLMPRATPPLPAPASVSHGRIVDLEFQTDPARAEHLTWTGTRKVHVYLPPGYADNPGRRYPAVYVLYGKEMLEDGGLAALIDRESGKTLAPIIAVFVESTSAYEYARTFREVHARMLAERLVPWIDGQFRTMTEAGARVLVGADEAGFGALEIGLRFPRVFGGIVAQSAFALSAGDRELLALIDRAPATTQRFHVDWGRYDPHRRSDLLDVPGFTRRVRERLAARGFQVRGREWNDGSSVTLWTARVVEALREIYPGR